MSIGRWPDNSYKLKILCCCKQVERVWKIWRIWWKVKVIVVDFHSGIYQLVTLFLWWWMNVISNTKWSWISPGNATSHIAWKGVEQILYTEPTTPDLRDSNASHTCLHITAEWSSSWREVISLRLSSHPWLRHETPHMSWRWSVRWVARSMFQEHDILVACKFSMTSRTYAINSMSMEIESKLSMWMSQLMSVTRIFHRQPVFGNLNGILHLVLILPVILPGDGVSSQIKPPELTWKVRRVDLMQGTEVWYVQ